MTEIKENSSNRESTRKSWDVVDELLVLNLYFDTYSNLPDKNDNIIDNLKITLNKYHKLINNSTVDVRNNNTIFLKLANFQSIDDRIPKKGMKNASKLDTKVFNTFFSKPDLLSEFSNKLITVIDMEQIEELIALITRIKYELDLLKYFSIKLSNISDIKNFHENHFEKKDLSNYLEIKKLSQHKDIDKFDYVFLATGGDQSKYEKGLYSIAQVIKAPYSLIVPEGKKKEVFNIQIKFLTHFTKVITKEDLYDFKETINIPNIGVPVKNDQTQPIGKLKINMCRNLMNAVTKILNESKRKYINFFPWMKKKDLDNIREFEFNNIFDNHEPALNVKNVAKVFSKFVSNYSRENTATMIGIFGKWGRGKTFFYDQLALNLNKSNKKLYFCDFKPWKYQDRESAWAYLYETLLDRYLKEEKVIKSKYKWIKRIRNTKVFKTFILNKNRIGYFKLFLGFVSIVGIFILGLTSILQKSEVLYWILGLIGIPGIIFLIKLYTLYLKSKNIAVSLFDMYGKNKDFSKYLGFQNEIEKEITILINTFISEENERLILHIDDLDRCNEKLIIDILDSIRLVIDNKDAGSKITIITSIDERILLKSIRHKYFDIKLNDIDPKEYVEKYFLLGLKLNKISDNDISELVSNFSKKLNEIAQKTSNNKFKGKNDSTNSDNEDENNLTTNDTENENILTTDRLENGDISTTDNSESRDFNILIKEEIIHLEKIFILKDISTPRTINMYIQRYLLFKSFLLKEFNDGSYKDFDLSVLIELVLYANDSIFMNSHYQYTKSLSRREYIEYINRNNETYEIINEDFIMILKYAEMVTPF